MKLNYLPEKKTLDLPESTCLSCSNCPCGLRRRLRNHLFLEFWSGFDSVTHMRNHISTVKPLWCPAIKVCSQVWVCSAGKLSQNVPCPATSVTTSGNNFLQWQVTTPGCKPANVSNIFMWSFSFGSELKRAYSNNNLQYSDEKNQWSERDTFFLHLQICWMKIHECKLLFEPF